MYKLWLTRKHPNVCVSTVFLTNIFGSTKTRWPLSHETWQRHKRLDCAPSPLRTHSDIHLVWPLPWPLCDHTLTCAQVLPPGFQRWKQHDLWMSPAKKWGQTHRRVKRESDTSGNTHTKLRRPKKVLYSTAPLVAWQPGGDKACVTEKQPYLRGTPWGWDIPTLVCPLHPHGVDQVRAKRGTCSSCRRALLGEK